MGNIMRQAQMAQRRIEEAQKKVEALEVEEGLRQSSGRC